MHILHAYAHADRQINEIMRMLLSGYLLFALRLTDIGVNAPLAHAARERERERAKMNPHQFCC